MKKFLSLVTGVLISVGTLSAFPVNADDWMTYGDFTYSVGDDGNITIGEYNGEDAQVVIPEKIDGKNVTVIGKCVFEDNQTITDVVLPNTVKEIDYKAFASCKNLKNINFPDELEKINLYAFTTCHSLEKIDLTNVKTIGECAFQLCISLDEITVGGGAETIVDHAFHGCHAVDTLIFENGVKTIKSTAALNMFSLKRIIIPASVTEIGEHALGYTYYHPNYTRIDSTIYGYKETAAYEYAVENGFSFVEIYDYGDVNGDGSVDSSDATNILKEYAALSTGGQSGFSGEQTARADIDKSGTVDSSDASRVLEYYAYISTGGTEIPMFYFFE